METRLHKVEIRTLTASQQCYCRTASWKQKQERVSFTLWMKFSTLVWRPHHLNLTVTSLYAHIRGTSGLANSSFCSITKRKRFLNGKGLNTEDVCGCTKGLSPSSLFLKVLCLFSLNERSPGLHPVYSPETQRKNSVHVCQVLLYGCEFRQGTHSRSTF